MTLTGFVCSEDVAVWSKVSDNCPGSSGSPLLRWLWQQSTWQLHRYQLGLQPDQVLRVRHVRFLHQHQPRLLNIRSQQQHHGQVSRLGAACNTNLIWRSEKTKEESCDQSEQFKGISDKQTKQSKLYLQFSHSKNTSHSTQKTFLLNNNSILVIIIIVVRFYLK